MRPTPSTSSPSVLFTPFCHIHWASRCASPLGHQPGFISQMKHPGHTQQSSCNTCSPTTLGHQGGLLLLLLILGLIVRMRQLLSCSTPNLLKASLQSLFPSVCSWPCFLYRPGRKGRVHLSAALSACKPDDTTILLYSAFSSPSSCTKTIFPSDHGLLPSFFNLFLCDGSLPSAMLKSSK